MERGGRSQWFSFGRDKLEMPTGYSSGDGRWDMILHVGNCVSE